MTEAGYASKIIWVRSQNCGFLVTWFCYQLIAKPGNKTATVLWPDPYSQKTPHNLPLGASYGISLLRIWVKIDRIIMALHCIWIIEKCNVASLHSLWSLRSVKIITVVIKILMTPCMLSIASICTYSSHVEIIGKNYCLVIKILMGYKINYSSDHNFYID